MVVYLRSYLQVKLLIVFETRNVLL